MNRDLIIPQLHQFFDAQFMAVSRKLLVFLCQPLGKLLLPDLQECAHLSNIVILAIILGADLPNRTARLCLYGIIGGVRFGCLSQKQQIAFPALHTLPVDITVGNAVAELPAVHTLYDTPSPTIDGYTDFIFRNRYGDLLNPHSLNRAIERIVRDYNAEESGLAEEDQRSPLLLPHFSVHSLRHTFCTRMFEVESNHKAIQTIMGHAEISTTLDIYAHITEDTLKKSVQHMSEKIKLFG